MILDIAIGIIFGSIGLGALTVIGYTLIVLCLQTEWFRKLMDWSEKKG